ncbi:MAG: hypothetical protein AABX71_02670 [Nanoarchaeota archaeon]
MYSKHEARVLFLKQFTKELILQSKQERAEELGKEEVKKKEEILVPALPISKIKPQIPIKPSAKFIPHKLPIIQLSAIQTELKPKTIPELRTKPIAGEKIELGKLNPLIQDPRVTMIECPGAEKPMLVRIEGKTRVSKISLNGEEIKQIIDSFSEKTKIPVIKGLFKAIVGNLVITAVISELVGSRFIITKYTPQFILEETGRKLA